MDLHTASNQIKKNSWDIIEGWLESVLSDEKIESSYHISKLDLIDGMPVVLRAVAKNITKPIEKELEKTGLFGIKASDQSITRLNQGYSLAEIFREYTWLREQILLHLEKNKIIAKNEYLLHSRLDRAIDEQLLNAVDTFTANFTKELKKKATTDPLTNILNRRAFFSDLDRELKRAKRYGHDVALLLIDLDNFKQLNDKLGHLAGDRYLKNFSSYLTRQSRDTDYVARVGGDEFALILPETSLRQATDVIKRIEGAFSKIREFKTDLNISVSIGISINGTSSPIHIYNAADKALFRAKKRKAHRTNSAKKRQAGNE